VSDGLARELAAFGPFFEIQTHQPDDPPGPPWRAMSELTERPDVLAGRVEEVRARLAAASGRPPDAVRRRVGASVAQLGLVARLFSPAFAAATSCGVLLDVRLAAARWQPVLGGGFPLSLTTAPGPAVVGLEPAALADLIARQVVRGPIADLTQAAGALCRSERVLWGNVASAVHGAASMMARVRPDVADRVGRVADLLLDTPPLRGTAQQTAGGFRRRNCCLIYQVAGSRAAVCGDCVLRSG
jgi:hypothetical protein